MPRNYINQDEREMIGIAKVMVEKLKDYIEANQKWMGVEEKKYLKTTCTFYDKFLVELMNRVGTKLGQRIINDFKGTRIYYKSNLTSDPSTVELSTSAVEALAEGVMYGHCRVCDCPSKEECHIRDLFTQCNVEPIDLDGRCVFYPNLEDSGTELLSLADEFALRLTEGEKR